MERPEAYPITYGVLGLLAFMGPLSGYDLKHLFDSMLAPMWGAAHSQIYNELRRMRELDWVEMEREEQESRPDRKVYHITQKGQKALTAWQSQPPGVYQIRDELLLKVMFGAFASPDALAKNLRAGLVEHEQRLHQYRMNSLLIPAHRTTQGEAYQGRSHFQPYTEENADESDLFLNLIAHFAVALEQTYIKWLQEAIAIIEHQPTGEQEQS